MALKIWNGSSWSSAQSLRVWNGSTWVSASTGRFWNGSTWQSFFSQASPLFLPATITENVTDIVDPYYGVIRVTVNTDGTLVVSEGNSSTPLTTTQTYTWKLSGSSSDYEVNMSSSTSSFNWNVGDTLDDWLNLSASRYWEYGVTHTGSEATYDILSTLNIRKASDTGISVSSSLSLSIDLGEII
jgi:hypothetical protein